MSNWAAILAGGSGTRFWPLSTPKRPKQMLSLAGSLPLIRQTTDRLSGLIEPQRTLIVTGRSLVDETRRVLPDVPPENILGEPQAASTAPALAWATSVAARQDSDATVLSLHADWFVGNDTEFRETGRRALEAARQHDSLVTVGIEPSRPESGYGYIVPGDDLGDDVRRVKEFIEKPDVALAERLIASGALWNSGLFTWTAERFFAETRSVAPELAPHLDLLEAEETEGFFAAVTPVAVDVSHFERSERVACVPGRFPWDDVGTWAALGRVRDEDQAGNVMVGNVFQRQSGDCVVWADDETVVLDGVKDLVVVRANGVTLVTTRQRSTKLKDLLNELPEQLIRPTE